MNIHDRFPSFMSSWSLAFGQKETRQAVLKLTAAYGVFALLDYLVFPDIEAPSILEAQSIQELLHPACLYSFFWEACSAVAFGFLWLWGIQAGLAPAITFPALNQTNLKPMLKSGASMALAIMIEVVGWLFLARYLRLFLYNKYGGSELGTGLIVITTVQIIFLVLLILVYYRLLKFVINTSIYSVQHDFPGFAPQKECQHILRDLPFTNRLSLYLKLIRCQLVVGLVIALLMALFMLPIQLLAAVPVIGILIKLLAVILTQGILFFSCLALAHHLGQHYQQIKASPAPAQGQS